MTLGQPTQLRLVACLWCSCKRPPITNRLLDSWSIGSVMSFSNTHTFCLPAVHTFRYTEISHKTRAVFACYDPAFVAGSLDGECRSCRHRHPLHRQAASTSECYALRAYLDLE